MGAPLNVRSYLNMRFASQPPRRAFTLLELLVSIAVIAILFTIVATVVVNGLRTAANRTVCAQNLRSLANAVLLYSGENKGLLPSPLGTQSNGWDTLIAPYLGYQSNEAPIPELRCPSDPRALVDSSGLFTRSYMFSGLINRDLDQPYGLVAFTPPSSGSIIPSVRRLQSLSHPPRTIMLFERMTSMAAPYDTLPVHQFSSTWSFASGWFSGQGPRLPGGDCYHGNKMNFAFADGHVESLRPEDTYSGTNLWRAIAD